MEDLRLRKTWPTVVRLIVSINNLHAVHMYRKYGLREVNAIKNYYGAGLHAVAMQIVVNGTDYKRVLQSEHVSSSLAMTLFTHGGLEICPVSYAADGALQIHDCPFGASMLTAAQDQDYTDAIAAKKQEYDHRMQSSGHFWLADGHHSDGILAPEHARALLDQGHLVTVEMSTRYDRAQFHDAEYVIEGCSLVPSGSWRRLPALDPTVLLMSDQTAVEFDLKRPYQSSLAASTSSILLIS